MEISQSTGESGRNRRRLVVRLRRIPIINLKSIILWILLLCSLPSTLFPQNVSPNESVFYEDAGRLPPLYEEEILAQKETNLYKNPIMYFCFMPGFIVFVVLLLTKKKKTQGLVFLFFCLSFLINSIPSTPSFIELGVSSFLKGDYDDALTMFKQAEEVMGPSTGLSYNNALCYYHLNKKGYAIFELHKAMKKAPMERRFIQTLRLIEEESGLTSQINSIPYIHPDFPFITTIVLFNVACIFLGLVFRFKKGVFVIVFVLLTIFLIGATAVFVTTQFQLQEKICVVISDNGMLKQIPLPSSRTWVLLKEGASLRILGNAKGYYLVKTGRGLKGWIREEDVKIE